VLVERRVDVAHEIPFVYGLVQVSVRLGIAGALDRRAVGVCGQVDDRLIALHPYPARGLNPVHLSRQNNVHEDQVRAEFLCHAYGVFARYSYPGNAVTEPLQGLLYAEGDNHLVLDDQDALFTHQQTSTTIELRQTIMPQKAG